jgi:hypothetical protein
VPCSSSSPANRAASGSLTLATSASNILY